MKSEPQNHSNRGPSIEFFDRLAENWDENEQNPAETVRRIDAMRDLLNLDEGTDLLEVGCGTGQLTGWLADQVAPGSVVAVDFSQKMLDLAKTKSDRAEFHLMDVCHDALEPNRFDVAFCFHCFPHFRNQAAALDNLAGSLRPGGRMLVVHLNSRQGINDFHDKIGGPVAGHHLPDDAGWDTLLSDAKLEKTMLTDVEGLFLLEAVKG